MSSSVVWCLCSLAECVLARVPIQSVSYGSRCAVSLVWQCCDVRDVEEAVLVLVLLIDRAHECSGRWQNLVDEDEDGLLGAELDALADHIDELSDGEICWHKVLLLVDRRDVRLLDLLADNLYSRSQRTRPTGTRWQAS